MKTRNLMTGILMLSALVTVPGVSMAALDTAQPTSPGLVGLWRMEGDWKDASGIGNHGSAGNGATFSTNAKIGAQSGSFDGVDDYVRVPDADTLSPQTNGQMSMSAWIYVRAYPSAGQGRAPIVAKGRDGNYEYAFYLYNKGLVGLSMWQPTGTSHIDVVGGTVPLNAWTHVAVVYDLSATKKAAVYVNGVEIASGTATYGSVANGSSPVEIGHRPDNYPYQYLNALMDDISIYNRALSQTEIQEQYRNYLVKSPNVTPVSSPTAKSTILLGGTKQADTAIAVNGNILVPLDGATSWQGSYNLAQGTNTISVTAVDSQNRSSLPAVLSVVLDNTPPLVTATAPAQNALVNVAPGAIVLALADVDAFLDFAATLSGASVTNPSGFQIAGSWNTSGSDKTGSIVFTPSAPLGDGSYTVTIKPTDVLGNVATFSFVFAIDRTPPAAPVIDPGGPSRAGSRTITGTRSSDSASVVLLCADAVVGTVSYPSATTWSVDISGLKEGANYLTAYAYDGAGNPSAPATAAIMVDTVSPTVGATPAAGIYTSVQSVVLAANEPGVIYYTIDGSAPTASAARYSQPISIPAGATLKYFARDLAGNDSEVKSENYIIDSTPPVLAVSVLSDGALTNNEIMNISGMVTDSNGVKDLRVNDAAVQVNADGSFSYALVLNAGANSVTVAATDLAGNKTISTRNITLDQTAPVLVVRSPADNSKTGTGLLELAGTVDKTSTVTVRRRDAVQSAVMNGGDFSATVSLDPGFDTIEITATDLAGNQSSQKRTVVFDDQVPSLAVTMPNQDVRTNLGGLTIKGTVYDALTAVGVTVTVDGNAVTVPVIDGAFEQVVTFEEEKTYAIVVTATNEAGTSTSVQRNVIYDITPPALGIDPVPSPTGQSDVTVTGTREAEVVVTVVCPTATVGEVVYPSATTWRVAVSGLAEGQNLVTAASNDAAGNEVAASATIVLATSSPEITVKTNPDVILPPKRKMVPVKITGGVQSFGSRIASTSVSVSDEYGKIQYKNLSFGSTVMLEAWCNGSDKDGRKYTITVVVTSEGGTTTTKTATVTVLHDKSTKSPPRRTGRAGAQPLKPVAVKAG